MPAPAIEYAASGLNSTQPDDSWIQDGVNPNTPWPARYLNWFIGYLQSTIFGAEHDPLTGLHQLTAEPAISGVSQTVWLPMTSGGWYHEDNSRCAISSVTAPVTDGPMISLATATNNEAYLDLNGIIDSIRGGATITSMKVYANIQSGTGVALAVEVEERDVASDRAYSSVASAATPTSGGLGATGATNPPPVSLYNLSAPLNDDARVRLVASGASAVVHVYGVLISYTPTKIVAG